MRGNDILQLGIPQGPLVKKALERHKELLESGINPKEIPDLLKKEFQRQEQPQLSLRQSPLPIAVAASAKTPEEEQNLAAAQNKMQELTLCPIITRAALMPDTCPSGQEFGCIPVGGAIVTENQILPAAHSSDVCCSMHTSLFSTRESPQTILNALEQTTRFGPHAHSEPPRHPVLEEPVWQNPFLKGLEPLAQKHLQTQGDGNHFASLGKIPSSHLLGHALHKEGYYEEAKPLLSHPDTPLWALTTHHGSRSLGAHIYKRGLEKAIEWTQKLLKNAPKSLAWLDLNTPTGQAYWEALAYAQRWTKANHTLIHTHTLARLQTQPLCSLSNAHNFVWEHQGKILHGKGATPAWRDELGRKKIGIIPLHMSSGILLTFGGDAQPFLSFSPHGAGRNKSRSETLKPFLNPKTQKPDPEKVQKTLHELTGHLDIRWASGKPDLSESPLGYKNATEIKRQLQEFQLAEIATEITPYGCLMAGEMPAPWKEKKKRQKTHPPSNLTL
jgi:RNA-splicing ligase RtcB